MGLKLITLATVTLVLSVISAHASIIDNGIYTTDTDSGLEWLDLTETTGRNYNDISSQLSIGGEFDGWRYATTSEISGFFDAFGGDSNFYDGWSTENNGLFDLIAPLWGDTFCATDGCSTGEGQSSFITAELSVIAGFHVSGVLSDNIDDSRAPTEDLVIVSGALLSDSDQPTFIVGSALVRTSVVPIPAAVWLFGSGLLGLIGVARRKA